jgi:hypothetical protein
MSYRLVKDDEYGQNIKLGHEPQYQNANRNATYELLSPNMHTSVDLPKLIYLKVTYFAQSEADP